MEMSELVALATKKEKAQRAYDLLAQTNTFGRTMEDQIKLDMDFQRAKLQLDQIKDQYDAAIRMSVSAS